MVSCKHFSARGVEWVRDLNSRRFTLPAIGYKIAIVATKTYADADSLVYLVWRSRVAVPHRTLKRTGRTIG